eukprot:CAMPEP_0113708776 /NCGR_PEP_ID=MMETSP0038_2-20120614/29182_1 /TAXON_ID=2898 /ORGANISM="Cryptomonas paramecium" /LENGTH=157 /DNA_ID=CAMNT_0000634545 /DNA_START=182 /DNA_END=652 /DNA_ORIENTATION=+ /assembly_acc=CAM_ASM_000170
MLGIKEDNKYFPIGRACGAMLGAAITVGTGVLSPETAFSSPSVIQLGVIVALFGLMIVIGHLEELGIMQRLAVLLEPANAGGEVDGHAIMARVCIVGGVLSAMVTNDTACLAMAPVVARLCRRRGLRVEPVLVGLATSANIGSAGTLVGNPQNLLIA